MNLRQKLRGLIYVRGQELSDIRYQFEIALKAARFFEIEVNANAAMLARAFSWRERRSGDLFWDYTRLPRESRYLALQDLQIEALCDRRVSHVIIDGAWRMEQCMPKRFRAMKRMCESTGIALVTFDDVIDSNFESRQF